MTNSFNNKKLLILGATKSEIEIINMARKMGIYTIATDNHTNWEEAPAKKVADEAWDISWSDIEKLKEKCIENNIDGCIAGFSERRIECAERLSTVIGKLFYADDANLDVICDKLKFKQACKDANIVVPKEYLYGEKIEYPVIVKPADNGGSRGITICYSDEELELGYKKALESSVGGNVLIEEYIVADEIMVYFTVHNSQIELSAICDRYMHSFDKNITQLPIGYYYPSKYLDIFVKYNLEKFKKLIHNLNIKDGLIAFQSFIKGNDAIPFDPTYRLDGTMAYHLIEKQNNINVLKMLIEKSITGKMGNDEEISIKETPYFNNPSFELPILLKNGIISEIIGIEDIKKMEDVIYVYQGHSVGERFDKKADFSQILCRIQINVKNDIQLKEDIDKIYSVLKVYDENGNDMIISRDVVKIGG